MQRIVKLTESDLTRIVRRVISEQDKNILVQPTKDLIEGATLTQVFVDSNPSNTFAMIGPRPFGTTPKVRFNKCSNGVVNKCFIHPPTISEGNHNESTGTCTNCKFYFFSKTGTRYLCKFTDPCKKM